MGTNSNDETSLAALLKAARAEPPASRIEFRDRIAAFGDAAIEAISPWLRDGQLGGFAVRVIEKAAAYGTEELAATTLAGARSKVSSEAVGRDVVGALNRLRPVRVGRTRTSRSPRVPRAAPTMTPEDLVVDRIYRRRQLHLGGLGGNWQSGISYPADGTYVLLFSDPNAKDDHGYADRWMGDKYFYFGQWTGTGDMVYEVGNQAILDRSTELYLFIAAQGGHRFVGRFRTVREERERTVRDGHEWTAIVFVLERHQLSSGK